MIADFDKIYAREVLPVLARKGTPDAETDIVAAHLKTRRVQTPLVSALAIVLGLATLTMFSLTFADGPLTPPGETGRLAR